MAAWTRRSSDLDLASCSRSVNQRRSALMSACRTVWRRLASSARVVPSTRLRTHRPTRPKATAARSGQAHRCLDSTRGALVTNRARVVVREPVPSVVTASDWLPPQRLSTETIRQGCLRVQRVVQRSKQAALKSEGRKPKAERNPKPEPRISSRPGGAAVFRIKPLSDFGSRPSFGPRVSGFGFGPAPATIGPLPAHATGLSFPPLHGAAIGLRWAQRERNEILQPTYPERLLRCARVGGGEPDHCPGRDVAEAGGGIRVYRRAGRRPSGQC